MYMIQTHYEKNRLEMLHIKMCPFIFLTLVNVHPGRKYRTMVIDAIITKSSIHTTIERTEGLKHDLQGKAEQLSRR